MNDLNLNNSDRRCELERRQYSYSSHIPERRSGKDRRSGEDRRSNIERRLKINKEKSS